MPDQPLKRQPPITSRRSPSPTPSPVACTATIGAGSTDRDCSIDRATSKELPRPLTPPTYSSSEITRIAQNESGARLIAKLLRELLQQQRFSDPSVLRDALEERCAALGLTCTRDLLERSMELVGSNTLLLTANQRRRMVPVAETADAPAVKPAEARAILTSIGVDVTGGRLQRTKSTSRLVPM